MRYTLTLAGLASLAAGGFVHPGVLIDQQQLDYVIAQVQSGGQPFATQMDNALKFTWINGHTNASGPPADGIIACGFFDNPDYGCAAEGTDSQAALLQSMIWMVTRNETWANRATTIMNHYAQNLKMYNSTFNGPLEAAWAADKWARAAEILSSTGAPWPKAEQQAFGQMLLDVSVPVLYNGSCYNGNWELAMIEGMAGIAVFTENQTLFDHAISMWRSRVPAYFYYAPTDGPKPVPDPSCKGTPDWYGQVVYNASTNGVCQETCRDFGHMSYGLASTFNTAETARIQGIDLYSEQKGRLASALEFHAKHLNKAGFPIPKGVNFTDPLVCAGQPLKLSDAPTFQVGLTGLSRLGYTSADLPETTAYVQGYLWPAYYNQGCDVFMRCYEALTHGAAAPGAGPLPPPWAPAAAT